MTAMAQASFELAYTIGATAPSLAADMALESRRSPKAPAGQCQAFFDRPVTDDLLPVLHDAVCCDVLVKMHETEAVNALERRLMCPAWHHFKMLYDGPPDDFEDLASVNVPPELVNIVIPPNDGATPGQPQPPLPLPQTPVQPVQAPLQPNGSVQQPSQPVSVPWTMMTSPAEFPEGVEWPEGYVPGPLNFGDQQ
jgi:hypothetical protein